MTLDELAVWDAPHIFTRGGDSSGHEWQRVFSYGLLLPAVPELRRDDDLARVASRWGKAETEELAPTLITRRKVTDDYAGTLWVVPGLREFVSAVRAAADTGERVDAGWEERMRGFLDHVKRPDRFVWRWDQAARVRVRTPRYDTLLERLAIEYDQLVTRRPRLARCKLCGRAFVPVRQSRPERYCKANLWLSAEPGRRVDPPVQLERCIPVDEHERLRTRKRLEQRYRRARERYGPRHPAVVEAKRERADFERRNPPARTGRQPQPQAQFIETTDNKGGNDG